MSPDFYAKATAFIMPLGGDNADAIVTLLNAEVPRLKKPVLSGLHLKYVPDFKFRVDDSFDRAAQHDALASDDVTRDLPVDEDGYRPKTNASQRPRPVGLGQF